MPDYADWTDSIELLGTEIQVPIDIQGAYIQLPVDIQGQYVALQIDIVAQSVGNIGIDIKAQTLSQLNVNIAASDITLNVAIQSSAATLNVNITGQTLSALNVNITGSVATLNINIASISSGVTMTVTGSVSITGTPSVTISGTPNVSITGTPNINIYSQSDGVWTKSEWAPKAGEAKYKQFTTVAAVPFGGSAYVDYTVTSGKNLYITHVGFYLQPSSAPASNVISGFCWINDNTAGQLLLNLGGDSGNGLSLATPLKVPGGNTVRILVCNCSSVSCYLSGSWGGFEV